MYWLTIAQRIENAKTWEEVKAELLPCSWRDCVAILFYLYWHKR